MPLYHLISAKTADRIVGDSWTLPNDRRRPTPRLTYLKLHGGRKNIFYCREDVVQFAIQKRGKRGKRPGHLGVLTPQATAKVLGVPQCDLSHPCLVACMGVPQPRDWFDASSPLIYEGHLVLNAREFLRTRERSWRLARIHRQLERRPEHERLLPYEVPHPSIDDLLPPEPSDGITLESIL